MSGDDSRIFITPFDRLKVYGGPFDKLKAQNVGGSIVSA
jgi:hypothetical protein